MATREQTNERDWGMGTRKQTNPQSLIPNPQPPIP
jgi:hypothetical protein